MAYRSKRIRRIEFGDFQTPGALARQVCTLLRRRGLTPATIIEPTCGSGNFLLAALDEFRETQQAIGLDLNSDHLSEVGQRLSLRRYTSKVRLIRADFFETDWASLVSDLPQPLLVIGNPPWVTNAVLGSLGSANLPAKSNFQNHRGMDAITGKSNFDISEWMMLRILKWLKGRDGVLTMLCKTAVARKVLAHAWKSELAPARSDIYAISALDHFGVSVDACVLVCSFSSAGTYDASVYSDLDAVAPCSTIGYRDGRLVADIGLYDRWKHLQGPSLCRWRSGIKHDCAPVLELERVGSHYVNGLGEKTKLEDTYLYPMLKSSDVANDDVRVNRWMLVTQRSIGEDTGSIQHVAPNTWRYLCRHQELLDKRASSIYRHRPRFSVFGVGPYSFAPWKVAISGFYKGLNFKTIGPFERRSVVLDDTCYFLPCRTEEAARCVSEVLNSDVAREFYGAFVFWDCKRPVTVDLLRRLDLLALARVVGCQTRIAGFFPAAEGAQARLPLGE
jgi:hypothetical protein